MTRALLMALDAIVIIGGLTGFLLLATYGAAALLPGYVG